MFTKMLFEYSVIPGIYKVPLCLCFEPVRARARIFRARHPVGPDRNIQIFVHFSDFSCNVWF